MKDGRSVIVKEEPVEDESTGPQQKRTGCDQDSTAVPRKLSIKMAVSKRVLIPAREYFAKCIRVDDPFPNRAFHKFQMKVHFQIHPQHVAEAGTIVTKFVECGRECSEPEIGPDTWLGRMMMNVTTDPQDVLLGCWFRIKVATTKAGYSTVREVELMTPARATKLEVWQSDGIPF
jgi:hypothetical protein